MPRGLTLLLTLLLLSGAAHAATYKWIDANGRVNYSDRPPDVPARALDTSPAPQPEARSPQAGEPALPYALRVASTRYPVTLFTMRECEPCDLARTHLANRGIPYTERPLRTERDLDALRSMGFRDASVPALRVGRETATGFQADAWDRLLDAAGYPQRSMLPAGWRPPGAPAAAQPADDAADAQVPRITVEQLNDPANQRDDMREGLVAPGSRPVPIIAPPKPAPPQSTIRF